MNQVLQVVGEIQKNLGREIDYLCTRVERVEKQGATNSLSIKRCADQGADNAKKIKLHDERMNELSRLFIKEEEKIPYVFTAPLRNRYFAGREKEIEELKRILKIEETSNEKNVRVAAVCGLGGIGKTSLVSEYAHQMKDFYTGGVYWFSAEDDTFLERTVNDIAIKLRALLGSFDLTLSNTFKKIATTHDPSLIVLDCLDQLKLSSKMMNVLSFPSRENIFGHFILVTRRNPKLVNEVSVIEHDSCLQLKCFQTQEAKQFLFSRTGVNPDENSESVAESLCKELGGLPLALEQAGACIKLLSCSLSLYLEQYKAQHLQLLNQQQARPVSPGNESQARLAVHTTWLINMEYMKKSPNGQAAVRFLNACSFFNRNEIEEELINIGKPEIEDAAYRDCVSSPLGSRQVLKLLTDFSLFTYVETHSVSTHRLVQELVREQCPDPKSKAESFFDAVRMVSYALFCNRCSLPSDHVSSDESDHVSSDESDHVSSDESGHVSSDESDHVSSDESDHVSSDESDHVSSDESDHVSSDESDHVSSDESDHVSSDETNSDEQNISFCNVPENPSHFHKWSKFCMHAHLLRREMENLLVTLDRTCLDSVWFLETAKILYESAVHLSANHKQEEAKRTLNFCYRILDWLPLEGYETVKQDVSNNSLFPLPIPLPALYQRLIKQYCIPPFITLEPLTEKPAPEVNDLPPETSVVAPETSDIAPEASDVAPEASNVVPEANDVAPEAGDAAPEAGDVAPEASDVVLETSELPSAASDLDIEKTIVILGLDGDRNFKEGRYDEALNEYSSAIGFAQDCYNAFNPLLLTKRAKVYIKLGQYEDALNDANDYIRRCPDCWEGYAWKALALDGLNKKTSADLSDKASADIAAALAFYYNKAIFSNFPPFKESFVGLQERIFICDGVDELLNVMFSHEVETGVCKILVLGSEAEYILKSDTVDKAWKNCIVVGARKNRSVSLKSDCTISLLRCMLTNLSFCFNKGQLHCLPGSLVKILNCNFTSYDDNMSAVETEGELNAEQCNFTNSACDVLSCIGSGDARVFDCTFCNNAGGGLCVSNGGTLIVKSSRIYHNNGSGLFIGPEVLKCVAVDCDIHHNGGVGIFVENSKDVNLKHNNVFGNVHNGIISMLHCEVVIEENNVFDNGVWGIFCINDSQVNIRMSTISRNKAGGICLECGDEGENVSLSVVQQNKIFDNNGPGFVEKSYDDLQSPNYCQDNEMYNNKQNEDVGTLNFSVPYCSNCIVKCEPEMCKKCFTTAYCSESCQQNHLSKHEKICEVLREKSSYLITSTEKAEFEYDTEGIESGEMIGPNFSSPLPRDDTRFVVKVHSATRESGSYALILYDRSLELNVKFDSKVIDVLLNDFGVLCGNKAFQKKLFFYCLFEDNGQLRLFTNEFAEFQNW